ncbi:MAG TPA: hypothetical protein VHC69_03385 [Polyangiaceae bacterium]|nr:hypothetical protein [Polyangiaceae bacterium]
MNGSPRGLASCKGERTGDPRGAVSCAELIELSHRKGKPIPLSAGLRIAKEVLEVLDRVGGARSEVRAAVSVVSSEKIWVGPSGEVSIRDASGASAPTEAVEVRVNDRTSKDRSEEECAPYSVAAVLYELLTGKRLFAEADLDSLARESEADLSAIAQPTPRLPLEVRLILASALSREPDERFKRPRDFADAIHSFAHHAHVPLGPSELTAWLATLELWPSRSGMFPRSDLTGYPEASSDELGPAEARRQRAR